MVCHLLPFAKVGQCTPYMFFLQLLYCSGPLYMYNALLTGNFNSIKTLKESSIFDNISNFYVSRNGRGIAYQLHIPNSRPSSMFLEYFVTRLPKLDHLFLEAFLSLQCFLFKMYVFPPVLEAFIKFLKAL